jgi:hypothetical protein
MDVAHAATHLGYLLTSEEQLKADHLVADYFNAGAEGRGWDIRLRVFGTLVLGRSGDPSSPYHGEARAAGGGLQLIELKTGAIEAAVRDRRPDDWLSQVLTRLLRAALLPPITVSAFRAEARRQWERRLRKNSVGRLFDEFPHHQLAAQISARSKTDLEKMEGRVAVLNAILDYWGVESIVPTSWPMRGALPHRQYHHISHIPLRDYSVSRRLLQKGGKWSFDFYDCQKGRPIRHILITPALEALYLATKLISPAEQQALKRIGRFYKLHCWYDHRGRTSQEIFSRDAAGAGFSHDAEKANEGGSAGSEGARPDLKELERKHEERLKKGLESDIRRAPQGGTVKVSRPAPAVRHRELERTRADYNDKHGSYMGTGGLNRRLREQKSLNIPKPDPLEAFAKLEKSHSWPLEITDGFHDNARRIVHRDHVGDGPRRRGAGG